MTPLALILAAGATGLVVLFPIAVVREWRNTRPERHDIAIAGLGPVPRRHIPAGRRGGPLARSLAERANLAEWGAYADRVAAECAWVFTPSRLPARRMMDASALWRPRPVLG